MSHFTVLVVGPDVENQLAPFQENNMGDCPREYMEFTDLEDDFRKEYDEESVDMVVLEDGKLVYTWDNMFQKGFDSCEAPAHLERRTVAHRDRYETFEEFVAEWHGNKARDEQQGRYGSWENPNRKWDWYALGGRWSGFFKLKPGGTGEAGSGGLFASPAKPGYVDHAMKKDIDFAGMRAEAMKDASDTYDKYEEIVRTHGAAPDFQDFYAANKERLGDDAQAVRKEYWSLPVVQALSAASLFPYARSLSETYGTGREVYVERAANNAAATFAILMNGTWYERGSMGWWGAVADEKDGDAWSAECAKMLESLAEDTMLTIIDCHI